MLAALGRNAPGYERLSGSYFLGGTTSVQVPTEGVPSARAPSARQPTQPGAEVPGPPSAIPASSQKPGNREGNQRIPYARMMFTFMDDIARPRYMRQGDVVFVHKTSSAMGHGPNRVTKCTGLPQLNQILAFAKPGITAIDYAGDPLLAARVQAVRVRHYEGLLEGAEHDYEAAKLFYEKIMFDHPASAATLSQLEAKKVAMEAKLTGAKAALPTLAPNRQDPECDWMALPGITQWTLDGVLISADDEVDVDDTNQPQLSRDDGILMNVAVQGPTAMRNTAWQVENFRETHEYDTQHVDESISVLDKIFVGLFQVPVRDDAGTLTSIAFQYHLFSGRQLFVLHIATKLPAVLPHKVPGPFAEGPTELEFANLVGAWRVGSVMDRRLTTDTERQMLVNVCVEWYTASRLEAEFEVQDEIAKKMPEVVPP